MVKSYIKTEGEMVVADNGERLGMHTAITRLEEGYKHFESRIEGLREDIVSWQLEHRQDHRQLHRQLEEKVDALRNRPILSKAALTAIGTIIAAIMTSAVTITTIIVGR